MDNWQATIPLPTYHLEKIRSALLDFLSYQQCRSCSKWYQLVEIIWSIVPALTGVGDIHPPEVTPCSRKWPTLPDFQHKHGYGGLMTSYRCPCITSHPPHVGCTPHTNLEWCPWCLPEGVGKYFLGPWQHLFPLANLNTPQLRKSPCVLRQPPRWSHHGWVWNNSGVNTGVSNWSLHDIDFPYQLQVQNPNHHIMYQFSFHYLVRHLRCPDLKASFLSPGTCNNCQCLIHYGGF